MSKGKTFEIRGEQTHEIIEEQLLVKGRKYEPVEPVRPKVKTVNNYKPIIYKVKGVKPEKPIKRKVQEWVSASAGAKKPAWP